MKKHGERFRECRETTGLSREKFAQLAGVSAPTIENIETGNKMSSLQKAVDAVGINMHFIETGKGSRWVDGKSDSDNERRLKAQVATGAQADPLASEIYRQQEERIKLLERAYNSLEKSYTFTQSILEQARQSGKLSFKGAPDYTSFKLASSW